MSQTFRKPTFLLLALIVSTNSLQGQDESRGE
jgi:hypothetical protein